MKYFLLIASLVFLNFNIFSTVETKLQKNKKIVWILYRQSEYAVKFPIEIYENDDLCTIQLIIFETLEFLPCELIGEKPKSIQIQNFSGFVDEIFVFGYLTEPEVSHADQENNNNEINLNNNTDGQNSEMEEQNSDEE